MKNSKQTEVKLADAGKERLLSDLPVGTIATIRKVLPNSRGGKKFADVGLVPGTKLMVEGKAPFGGLLRVKIMETSIAIHRDDAKSIVVGKEK